MRVAVLSRQPLKADFFGIHMDDPTDYHTVEAAVAHKGVDGKRLPLPASIFLGGTKVSIRVATSLRTTSAK